MSPITNYQIQLTSTLSIMHRLTGAAPTAGMGAFLSALVACAKCAVLMLSAQLCI